MKYKMLVALATILSMALLFSIPNAFAENTTIMPIDQEIALEKTETTLYVDKDDSRQWAFVEGKIENPATNYPVIIQILKDNELVHLAQVDTSKHGNYEYKFRVKTMDGEKSIQIFEGDYAVKIFKVVRNQLDSA